ncbi:FMN-dependent NADH-azoreductase [Amycolatopsis acididurans]|uniref:FMN-dependent NADH-azoreductase n=1 Tax=Amycolatopsis acididurans TaxID=2724524 RepID=UPI001B329337|nr:NAD(P)H-dependent oxidoreductase [Amycolatopsis acididurans]
MPTLLRLDSSAAGRKSVSRELTGVFTEAWRGEVVERDLHASPLPHLPDAALHYAPRLRTGDEKPGAAAERLQEQLVAELLAVDAVVIGAPMYNWSIPSTLKAWLDYVHVLGTTVPFDTQDQPLAGKPVVVLSSRGLEYGPGTPDEGKDHTLPPIVQILGVSMGMDVTALVADLTLAERLPPLAPLAGKARDSLAAAHEQARELAGKLSGAL